VIRQWARQEGITLGDRGRLAPGSRERVVKEQYARQDGHVFEGFALRWVDVDVDDDVRLRVRVGGHGHALD
jgi:hypothetical protein